MITITLFHHTFAFSVSTFSLSVTTFPLSLGEGRGEDSLSFVSKPSF